MPPLPSSRTSESRPARHPGRAWDRGSRILRRYGIPVALTALLALPGLAQKKPDKTAKADRRESKRDMGPNDSGASGGKPRTEDPMERGLARLRENLEVTDDTEWEIIAARIKAVVEVRTNNAKSGGSPRGGPGLPVKSKAGPRSGASAHPEQDALRYAVRDKLPDAEVKARLARAHEVHLQNEARLAKAQDDLRSVLTVRQEAVAVLAGLLPP